MTYSWRRIIIKRGESAAGRDAGQGLGVRVVLGEQRFIGCLVACLLALALSSFWSHIASAPASGSARFTPSPRPSGKGMDLVVDPHIPFNSRVTYSLYRHALP